MTAAEQIRQRGIQEGELSGKRQMLLKIVRKRFGYVSPELEDKLYKSESEVLEKFGEIVLDLDDLEEAENWWLKYGKEGNA